jgi:hypothetical protein
MRKALLPMDDHAQVLGLPMYLIIVMIVAVAVIAAVIYMIPQGTGMMNVQVTDNAVIAESVGNASKFTFSSDYEVIVKVTTRDESASPIAGATVTLLGSGDAASDTTNANGIASLMVTPTLAENSNEDYMKLNVKAAGYQEYSDEQAVTVYRLS